MENFINKFAIYLANNSPYSAETLIFCIKLWLSTIFQTVFLFVISLLFLDIKIFMAFVIIFCTLRSFIEGYHCKTFIHCFLLTNFMFFIVVVLSHISAHVASIAFVGKLLIMVSFSGLLYNSICCFDIDNTKKITLLYSILRILIVSVFAIYIIFQLFFYGIYGNVHKWTMLYAYCLVFILSIPKGGVRYKK